MRMWKQIDIIKKYFFVVKKSQMIWYNMHVTIEEQLNLDEEKNQKNLFF